jgi:hypothetical protein
MGTDVRRYRSDASGQQTVLAADSVTSRLASSYANQIGFTGQYVDEPLMMKAAPNKDD